MQFFVKWQDHVYDFEIMIWNHNSDSGILQRPVSVTLRYYTNSDNVSNKGRISLMNYYSKAYLLSNDIRKKEGKVKH